MALKHRVQQAALPWLLALLAMTTSASVWAQDVVIDAIAAVVNDSVVLESEIRAETRFLLTQAASEGASLPQGAALRERVLDRLIDQEVRQQHARRLGIGVDAGAVNRAIEQIAANNNLDVSTLRNSLRAQGFDFAQFRRNIEQELLLQELVRRDVAERINVSQREIDDFVEALDNDAEEQRRYRIRHILVAVAQTATSAERDAAAARAAGLLTALRGGRNFAELAAAESDGARALDGGDLGFRRLQELPGFISTQVADMAIGDIAGPIESPNGLHIITLIDTRNSDPRQQGETLARHVFIAGDDTSAQARIDAVSRRIASGESFERVAIDVSEDPNSAPDGGELPWFTEGELPPEFDATAASLSIGEVSAPFRTRFGWHVIEVLDRRTRGIDTADVRQRAEQSIRQRRVEQEAERWMLELRAESFIDIRS